MPDHITDKARLRIELRRLRRSLAPAARVAAAEALSRFAPQIPGWSTARRIALYLASDGEIDTIPLSKLCRAAGMQVFLPVIDGAGLLGFAEWAANGTLAVNRFGIPEPVGNAPRSTAAQLDIVMLPLVAWDSQGGRLGMGGGFYDRALAGIGGTLRVGLSHSVQQLARVPRDDWDVPLDFVLTDTGLHRCRGNS